jgi:hypothetical protein
LQQTIAAIAILNSPLARASQPLERPYIDRSPPAAALKSPAILLGCEVLNKYDRNPPVPDLLICDISCDLNLLNTISRSFSTFYLRRHLMTPSWIRTEMNACFLKARIFIGLFFLFFRSCTSLFGDNPGCETAVAFDLCRNAAGENHISNFGR